ncbi:MAG: PQQ-binding-like beta-propeller repeat protein [bacterium]|nr:PQQ-binding-like beta-propeller repeat protein [bacterium]
MAWGWLIVSATLLNCAAEAPLPPGMMPETLFAMPVAASEALIQGDIEGVRGVVLTDAFPLDPDAPVAEFEGALASLRDAGIAGNFLTVALAPERPFFVDPGARGRVLQAVGRAANLVRDAGGRGLLLDTQSISLFYDFRWRGYDYAGYGRGDLTREARAFGSDIAGAASAEGADTTLLVTVDDVSQASPLWFSLFAGLVDGCGDHTTLHVVARETGAAARPDEAESTLERVRRMFGAHGGGRMPNSVAPWISLDPATTDSSARYAGAILAARRYVVLEPGLEGIEDALRAMDAIDGFERVGPYTFGGSRAFILRNEEGAAAVALDGFVEPVRIPRRRDGVTVTDVRTGRAVYLEPHDGFVTLQPMAAPVLVEGLPVQDWAVPAGLWAGVTFAGSATARHDLRYGWTNRTGLTFAGSIGVMATDLHVEPAGFECSLVPGETGYTDGFVRGVLPVGAPVRMQLVLTTPGSGVVARDFRFTRPMHEAWRIPLPGALGAVSEPVNLNQGDAPDMVVTTATGEVVAVDATGRTLWERQFDGAFTWPAGVGSGGPRRDTVVAVVDDRGTLHALDKGGATLWSRDLESAPAGPPVVADMHLFTGLEVIVPLAGGLRAFHATGHDLWTLSARETPVGIRAVEEAAGAFDALVVGYRNRLACLFFDGATRWEHDVATPITVGPVALYVGDAPAVAVGHADGAVVTFRASDVEETGRCVVEGDSPVAVLVSSQNSTARHILYAGAGGSVVALARDHAPAWRTELETRVTHIAVDRGDMLVTTENGEIAWLNAVDGTVHWVAECEGLVVTTAPRIVRCDCRALGVLPGPCRTLRAVELAE